MANLLVDERDAAFVLFEQLDLEDLCKSEHYQEFSREIFDMALNEAQKLAVNEIMPTNIIGDREGCKIENGQVKVPTSFHKIWDLYREGGWIAMSEPPEVGGQGMPSMLAVACNEIFVAANCSFTTCPGLTHGAARLIQNFGTQEQHEKYLQRMYAGEWAGTMALTEPQAGTDVGALTTSAKPNPDGTYTIAGNKLFITCGDHDYTENIVHAVLARIEGAPAGTKGLSLFVVPKYRINDDGSLGQFNDVNTGAIEHKMGIHASPTCVLSFGDNGNCIGELLGEENKGMRCMFQMMNEARLGVGLQGLGMASTAYLHALQYAKDRVQGPDISEFRNPEAAKVSIIRHPDVRRMLMYMKSLVEGIRGMIYFAAYCGDRAHIATSEEDRNKWMGFMELLTPIVKAYGSDMAFKVADVAMQVYGGYGYIREYPIEQFLRDVKIASIYEGTNGVQAMDLVARKIGMGKGMVLMSLLGEVSQFIESAKDDENLKEAVEKLEASKNAIAEAAMFFASKATEDITVPLLYATPFLELFGDMVVGWQLLWQAGIAHRKLQDLFKEKGAQDPEAQERLMQESRDAAYYAGKVAAARFFANTFLSLSPGKAQAIKNADKSAIEIPEAAFASS